jgi:hypothetical protein
VAKKLAQYPRPRAVPVEAREEAGTDTPFAEGKDDGLGENLRHRLISERAYARYFERGDSEGYHLDDWLEAEAEVDHMVLTRPEIA